MTKKRSLEFLRDEMKNFQGFQRSLGQRSQEWNLSVEMCSHELFWKHALHYNIGPDYSF